MERGALWRRLLKVRDGPLLRSSCRHGGDGGGVDRGKRWSGVIHRRWAGAIQRRGCWALGRVIVARSSSNVAFSFSAVVIVCRIGRPHRAPARGGRRRVGGGCRHSPDAGRRRPCIVSLGTRLLEDDGFEVVSLLSVVLDVFFSVAKLLLKTSDAKRCLSLLLLSSGAEPCRCACVALSLFVRRLGRSLDINRDLYVVTLLGVDGHDLVAALAGGGHGDPATLRVHGYGNVVGLLHRRIARSCNVRVLLARRLHLTRSH